MAVLGMRGTGDWGTDERPKNFREMILWRNPNGSAVLTALMARMRKQSTDDPEFAWWEEELNPVRLRTTTAHTTGELVIDIDDGDAEDLIIGDVLLVETAEDATYTAEIVTVAAIASTDQFTVGRGKLGSTAATIADNTFLTKIGNAFEEGSISPSASTRNPTKFLNYTQIFKTAYRITGTARATRARTGDALKNDKKRKMFDHSVANEFALLFGKAFEDTSGTKPKRYTGGLREFMGTESANAAHVVHLWTTAVTEQQFMDEVYKIWDYTTDEGAGNQRLVLCGNGWLNTLNKIALGASSTRMNYDGVVNIFGMNLMRWILPQGELFIKTHPLMNVHGRYQFSAFIINPAGLIYRPLRGRDTKPDEGAGGRGIQANDADELKGQWIGEFGVEFHHLKTMQYQGDLQTEG